MSPTKASGGLLSGDHPRDCYPSSRSVLLPINPVCTRPANITDAELPRLVDLLHYNLRAVRSYLLREEFQYFWAYVSPTWAGRFLDRWCTKVLRARIAPMQKVARMLRAHRPLLLNWFRAKGTLSAAVVEGVNNKARETTRTAYGFRTYRAMEIALYHTLGALPEPEAPHRFC